MVTDEKCTQKMEKNGHIRKIAEYGGVLVKSIGYLL